MNDSTKKESKKEETQPVVSSLSIRSKFSLEEINKMLGDIDAVISNLKAEMQGIDPEDMIKTVRGGRVVWITKEEMNTILAKQRKLTGVKYVKRSARGEDSLSSEINRRVEACRALINAVRKAAPEESAELSNRMRELEAMHNQSLSHAKEVRLLETAIHRKKMEDPILKEMENANAEMLDAFNKNELAEVDVCQSFCDRHMEEYLAKQKRIEPYVKKAKECRLAFLQTKQALFQFQFGMIEKGKEMLTRHIEEIVYHDKESVFSPSLAKMAQDLGNLLEESRSCFLALAEYPLEELENQKEAFNDADKRFLAPLFNQIVDFVELFKQAWSQCVEKKGADLGKMLTVESAVDGSAKVETTEIETAEDESAMKRMVYQEQKEQES
ncbi:MAG: hypothetical protein AB1656_03765 [Candidatus Omnitrophota bacterium]